MKGHSSAFMPHNKAPCRNCTERHPACHDTCEKYQEFQQYMKLKHKWEREQYERTFPHTMLFTDKKFLRKKRK